MMVGWSRAGAAGPTQKMPSNSPNRTSCGGYALAIMCRTAFLAFNSSFARAAAFLKHRGEAVCADPSPGFVVIRIRCLCLPEYHRAPFVSACIENVGHDRSPLYHLHGTGLRQTPAQIRCIQQPADGQTRCTPPAEQVRAAHAQAARRTRTRPACTPTRRGDVPGRGGSGLQVHVPQALEHPRVHLVEPPHLPPPPPSPSQP
jgi:hypothetical protein